MQEKTRQLLQGPVIRNASYYRALPILRFQDQTAIGKKVTKKKVQRTPAKKYPGKRRDIRTGSKFSRLIPTNGHSSKRANLVKFERYYKKPLKYRGRWCEIRAEERNEG